jgi:translation initiation factor 5B
MLTILLASSLGSLEALIDFLKSNDIPIGGANIGPVTRRDVLKAGAAKIHHKGYCAILAFDVQVKKSAAESAREEGVTIFQADIIYHLFDRFKSHMKVIIQICTILIVLVVC